MQVYTMQIHINSSRLVRLALMLLLAGLALQCRALQFDNLYVGEVLVTDESRTQLRSGARAGLLQVLIRVSGLLEVETSELVSDSLRNPAVYYYQYSYRTSDQTLLVGTREVPAKILTLHFEPSAIARLLRDADFPVWGSNRPSVMLWVAASDGQERRVLSEVDPDAIVSSLIGRASERGLPLLFPILDLEDAASISSAEIWGAFLDRIEEASERYNPDAILTARIQQESAGNWSGHWSWQISDDQWQSSQTLASSAEELVYRLMDQLADDLAARFALDSSRARVDLLVEGVTNVVQYAALGRYLDQLPPVLNSKIIEIEGDAVRFELETEGQLKQLVEIIELDQRMAFLGGDRFVYRWVE